MVYNQGVHERVKNMRVRIIGLLIAAVFLLFCGCEGDGKAAESQKQETSGIDISSEYSADEAVPMDASGKYLGSVCDTAVLDEITDSLKTEEGDCYEAIRNLLSDSDIYAAVTGEKWTESCFVSDVVIPSYNMHSNRISDNYTVLAFSNDLTQVFEITVRRTDSGFALSVSDFSSTMRQMLRENREEKFIFVKNAGFLAVDSINNVYVIDSVTGNSYEILGDFYHAVDYRTLSVSYDEIMAQNHLHEIRIVG